MKSWIALFLAASALGACATATDERAALRAEAAKAELASVSQEIIEIDAWVRGQVILGRDIGFVMRDRALAGRLMGLVYRQRTLRAELAEAGYPRTAEEVRERIMEIDQTLTTRGETLAPAGAPSAPPSDTRLAFVSPSLTMNPTPSGPSPESASVAPVIYPRMTSVPGSSTPRGLEWSRMYALKEERAALLAKLRTLEASEN